MAWRGPADLRVIVVQLTPSSAAAGSCGCWSAIGTKCTASEAPGRRGQVWNGLISSTRPPGWSPGPRAGPRLAGPCKADRRRPPCKRRNRTGVAVDTKPGLTSLSQPAQLTPTAAIWLSWSAIGTTRGWGAPGAVRCTTTRSGRQELVFLSVV